MAVKVCVLGVLLVGLTLHQQRTWRSDVALWAQAAEWNRGSARVAYNYGLALRKAGDVSASVSWFLEASHRAQRTPEEANYKQAIKRQLEAVEMSGYPVCHLPDVQPFC